MNKAVLTYLLGTGVCFAQVIDNVKNVWQPGFYVQPKIGSLSFTDRDTGSPNTILQQFDGSSATAAEQTAGNEDTPPVASGTTYYQEDASKAAFNKLTMLTYGLNAGWNTIMLTQWFNSLSVGFELFKPKYGANMAYYYKDHGATGIQDDVHATTSADSGAVASMHLHIEDVILHANHDWGSVLPYIGVGADYFKIGGHLTYADGAQRTSQIIYLPLGAYFQLNSAFSGKMQLNIPLSAKSKYYAQTAALVTNTVTPATDTDPAVTTKNYEFTFADAKSFEHDVKDSIGFECSMLINSALFGSGIRLEPYMRLWHLGPKDSTTNVLSRRWRSFGLKASINF